MKKNSEKPKYTISHLSMLTGVSSPVLRAWERKGLINSHRDQAGNRKYDAYAIRDVATKLYLAKKISLHRHLLICAWTDLLLALENM